MDDQEMIHYRVYGSLPPAAFCGRQGPTTPDTGKVTCEQCTEPVLWNEGEW